MPIDEVGIHPNAAFRGHIVMNEVFMKYNPVLFKRAQVFSRLAVKYSASRPLESKGAWRVAMNELRRSAGYEVKREG